jgi:lipid II:glycine glycyltransferase (peptidoglycan interpeptide bridge formation enzyme)
MFRASEGGQTIAMDLWYVQGDVAQGHLAAMNARGYEVQAAYGLKLAVIEYFTGKVRWLNLGGVAGLDATANDGLTAFKRGWAGQTRTAWFCGRVLQPERYQEILRARNLTENSYFPAYRAGEFV